MPRVLRSIPPGLLHCAALTPLHARRLASAASIQAAEEESRRHKALEARKKERELYATYMKGPGVRSPPPLPSAAP